MKLQRKAPDGNYMITFYKCDNCGEIIDDRPVNVHYQDLCPYCFNAWWSQTKPFWRLEEHGKVTTGQR